MEKINLGASVYRNQHDQQMQCLFFLSTWPAVNGQAPICELNGEKSKYGG